MFIESIDVKVSSIHWNTKNIWRIIIVARIRIISYVLFLIMFQAVTHVVYLSRELDPGLEEAIASIIWASPRLQADVQELKLVTDQLTSKYGKEFAQACRTNELNNVNEKVMHKLGVQAPPKILVERYMIEIAKTYNVPFEPDPSVMSQDEIFAAENLLIDLGEKKGGGGGGNGGPSGGMGVLQPQSGGGASASAPSYPPPQSQYPPPQQMYPPPQVRKSLVECDMLNFSK